MEQNEQNEKPEVAGSAEDAGDAQGKKKELLLFLFLAVLMAPFLAVVSIGGYGFILWMLQ